MTGLDAPSFEFGRFTNLGFQGRYIGPIGALALVALGVVSCLGFWHQTHDYLLSGSILVVVLGFALAVAMIGPSIGDQPLSISVSAGNFTFEYRRRAWGPSTFVLSPLQIEGVQWSNASRRGTVHVSINSRALPHRGAILLCESDLIRILGKYVDPSLIEGL